VGQTANLGTPFAAGFPVRGYEFYDGRVGARRVTFVNYQPGGGRQMSGLGFNRSNGFPIDPGNLAEGVRYVNSNQVYLENPRADKDGDRGAVFQDVDGSVSGTPGQFVVANNPLLVTPGCTLRVEWNAYACSSRFVRLTVRGVNGEVIGPADVTRDDGATATYVGTGGDPASVSMALPVGRQFTIRSRAMVAQRPQLIMVGMGPTDWVRVAVPWAGSTVKVYRDYDTSRSIGPATSPVQLDGSSGQLYYLDPAAGMLHLKFMPQPGRTYSVFYLAP
jgi:cell migration-inducing and hyaluronan-binding protein